MSSTIQEIQVTVIQKRIRHMYIRIHRDRSVVVTAPLFMKRADIRRFVEDRRPWLEKHLAAMAAPVQYQYVDGESHYVLGRPAELVLRRGKQTEVHFSDGKIHMTIAPGIRNRNKVYAAWAGEELGRLTAGLCQKWAPVMGVTYSSITIKNVKSRWGSCNVRTGALTFALDLITKPLPCIEAVVVHELNHRLEKGHTKRFHALMAHWLPDYKERSKRLDTFPREFM